MSQIANPHYLINGPFGIYGPGWPNGAPPALGFQPPPGLQGGGGVGIQWPIQPVGERWVPNSPAPGTTPRLGSTLYDSNGRAVAYEAQTQTPSQATQSNQPAPTRPAPTPGPSRGTYGYATQGSYGTAPIAPVAGAAPQGPAYTPSPQPLSVASAPAAPSLVNAQPRPVTAVGSGQTIMSTPPMNPLHAEIQRQIANNTIGQSFQSPYFSDVLNRRYPGYQIT